MRIKFTAVFIAALLVCLAVPAAASADSTAQHSVWAYATYDWTSADGVRTTIDVINADAIGVWVYPKASPEEKVLRLDANFLCANIHQQMPAGSEIVSRDISISPNNDPDRSVTVDGAAWTGSYDVLATEMLADGTARVVPMAFEVDLAWTPTSAPWIEYRGCTQWQDGTSWCHDAGNLWTETASVAGSIRDAATGTDLTGATVATAQIDYLRGGALVAQPLH